MSSVIHRLFSLGHDIIHIRKEFWKFLKTQQNLLSSFIHELNQMYLSFIFILIKKLWVNFFFLKKKTMLTSLDILLNNFPFFNICNFELLIISFLSFRAC
jgi:hypothetical protein